MNASQSAVNAFLDYIGHREYQLIPARVEKYSLLSDCGVARLSSILAASHTGFIRMGM